MLWRGNENASNKSSTQIDKNSEEIRTVQVFETENLCL